MCFCLPFITNAQEVKESYTLKAKETGTKNYIARDYILLQAGFSYKPGSGESLELQIDQCLLFPPTDASYKTLEGEIIDDYTEGGVVGTLSGSINVSSIGAATYSVPLRIPSGINNVQPNLAVVYNSQAGNGILGWGMNLSGLSAISIAPHSLYYDGEKRSVQYDGDDRFVLDGQMLLVDSEYTYGANGAEYYTESDVATKHISHGSSNNVPRWFEVKTKGGLTLQYGNSTSSLINLPSGKPYMWRLNKVTDTNGNYMVYEYEQIGGESWVSSITYTKNDGDSSLKTYTIRFGFITRIDQSTNSIAGELIPSTKKLNQISILYGTKRLFKYIFDYDSDLYTRLTSITYEGNDYTYYNPTIFTWDAGVTRIDPNVGVECEIFLPGDFNNDGLDDLYTIEKVEATNDGEADKYYDHLYLSNGTSLEKQTYSREIEEDYDVYDGWYDYNRDGYVDVINYTKNSPERKRGEEPSTEYKLEILKSNGVDFEKVKVFTYDIYFQTATGDFNGDGLDDVMLYFSDGSCRLITYDISTDTFSAQSITTNNLLDDYTINKDLEVYAGDFNGDGMADFGLKSDDDSEFSAYNLNGDELETIYSKTISNGFLRVGDFNGDGVTDFGTYFGTYFNVYFKNKNTWVSASTDTPKPQTFEEWCVQNDRNNNGELSCQEMYIFQKIKTMDVNSDGKSDILYAYTRTFTFSHDDDSPIATQDEYIINDFTDGLGVGGIDTYENDQGEVGAYKFTSFGYVGVGLGRGDGSFYFIDEMFTGAGKNSDWNSFCLFDLNGDGCKNIYLRKGGHLWDWNLFAQIVSPPLQNDNIERKNITNITNGLGKSIDITYSAFTKPDGIYTADESTSFPLVDYHPRGFGVERLSYSGPDVDSYSNVYHYNNAKFHTQGRGFMGFKSTSVRNTETDISTLNVSEFKSAYNILLPEYQSTTLGSENTPVSYISNTNEIRLVEGKRYQYKLAQKVETDHLKSISQTTSFTYDNYGNILTSETKKGNLTESVTYSDYQNAGAWCPSKPKLLTKVNTLGSDSETRTIDYTYDSNGNIKSKIKDKDDKNELTTSYSNYDTFGNSRLIESKWDNNVRSTSFSYLSGKFVHTKTSSAGFTTTYNYSEQNGLLTSAEDHLGLTTNYKYDGFGRLIKTIYPDGTYAVNALQWNNGDGPSEAIYYKYNEGSGQSPVWTWYDGLGREIRKDVYGFKKDKKIYVETNYNTKGQKWHVSEPYLEGETSSDNTTYEYDDYGRIETITSPAGETGYSYTDLTTTITSPTGTAIKVENAAGQLTSSSINGKTVTFEYWPSGLTKTATPKGGVAVETTFDLQGNRISLVDPDAGTITSEYNGFGELVWQEYKKKDEKGNLKTIRTESLYDTAGRNYKTTVNGVPTETKFSTTTGFVDWIKKDKGHEVYYKYDENGKKNLGRVTTLTEKIDGKSFSFKTTYDAFGREKTRTYPSGYSVSNYYTATSHLEQVKDPSGNNIWKGELVNARGQFKQCLKGSKVISYDFDERGLPKTILSNGIIDQFYQFKDDGNLEYRQDGLSDYKESFTYTTNKQLETWKIQRGGNAVANCSMNYDEQGNITSKSDLDNLTMTYGENNYGPHAITSISGNPALIANDEQTITYTDFKKVATIKEGSKSLVLTYGIDEQRRVGVFNSGKAAELTRYYLGDYEEDHSNGNVKKIHYIAGGNGLASIYIEENGEGTLYHTYTDYLGSLTALTDKDGHVVERYAFDPWGNRRNPSKWEEKDSRTSWLTDRGYTMHEHLDGFALINMNGRVYDPVLGRFLSPDPRLTDPGNWLHYNRYAYGLNNPFMYTDPTGEFPWLFAAGFLIGGYLSGTAANNWEWNPGKWENNMNTWSSVIIGGIAGGLGFQAALGSGGWLSGQRGLLFNIGINFGEHATAIGQFALNSGVLSWQGAGYATVAGGGLWLTNQDWDGPERNTQKASSQGETWYYGVQGTGDVSSHAFVYNPNAGMIYEINHVSADPNVELGFVDKMSGLTGIQSGSVISIGRKYNMNDAEGRLSFMNFRDGRPNIRLIPVNVPNPNRSTMFFESFVGRSWHYSLLNKNCKYYAITGLRLGGVNNILIQSPLPTVFNGTNVRNIDIVQPNW